MGLVSGVLVAMLTSPRNKKRFVAWMSEAYQKDLGLTQAEAMQRAESEWKSASLYIEIQWLAAAYREMNTMPAAEAYQRAYDEFASPEKHSRATDFSQSFKGSIEASAGQPVDPRYIGRWHLRERQLWDIPD